MVDSIGSEFNTATHNSLTSRDARSDLASKASNEVAARLAAREEPDVAITEVASRVASEKQHSLESLNQIATELREAISTLNAALEKSPTKAIITRDEDLNRFIVRIADQSSGEVVREIPSEAVLKFARNLQELKGLIFDKSL